MLKIEKQTANYFSKISWKHKLLIFRVSGPQVEDMGTTDVENEQILPATFNYESS